MNAKRLPMFDRRTIVTIVLLLALYALLAEVMRFYLITLPLPGYHPVAHRMGEIAALWTVALLLYGWFLILVKRANHYRINVTGPAMLPLVIGVLLTVYKVFWSLHLYVPAPAPLYSSHLVVTVISSAWPFIMGLGAAASLIIHGYCWRLIGATRITNHGIGSIT